MKNILLTCIKFYRSTASSRNPRCRFHPSCSQYAQQSIEQFGTRRGLWISVKRLLRCRPFSSYGYDPVPEK